MTKEKKVEEILCPRYARLRMTNGKMKVILASSSENRRELFSRMGIAFEQIAPDFEEVIDESRPPLAQIKLFALEKAKSVFRSLAPLENVLVMGFDSMIDFEGRSIGKPATRDAAFRMLKDFIAKPQKLSTAMALVGKFQNKYFECVGVETSKLAFRSDITDEQIRRFLDFGDWRGKCGAYSILGTGIFFLKKFSGDFQNIIGVPVQRLGNMIFEITGRSPFEIFEPRK